MASSRNEADLLGKRTPEDDFETKPILKKLKEQSEEDKDTTKGSADSLQQRVELFETKSDQANLISVKETLEGLDQSPKEATARKKTLFISNLSLQTKILDIIRFFNDVGQLVHVRLLVNEKCKRMGYGFLEFASANEAEKALQKKSGEYLNGRKIFLDVVNKGATNFPPKYYIDHKVWYKDFLRQENLPIEEDETPPDFVEEVLFVANLSPQTKILHIMDFFKEFGEVVSVRLIVNHESKHVGYGFVEFASANEAKKVLKQKNGEYLHDRKILLDVAKTVPYPPGPKYNLAETFCYEDYLRRESLVIEEDEAVEGLDQTPNSVEAVAVRKKTLFVAPLSYKTKILHIIKFFKHVGEVVHVLVIVNHRGNHVGYGFVEFASAEEAKKALQKKNGIYMHNRKIVLDVAKITPNHTPKYCIDHKVWYEDYLRRENLLIEEDEAVEGLDQTPDFVKEIVARKKSLFVANLPYKTKISDMISFFKDVGEVVRVRLIVNHRSERMGCGFVEFASPYEAKKALQKKNGNIFHRHNIFLDVAKTAPYPLRPKYNLAEKLWQEDYLRQQSLLMEENDLETNANMKKMKVFGVSKKLDGFCGKKITFSYDD